jgi:hypothetical protein
MKRRLKKLLEWIREAIRLKHYSIRTEEAYVNWVKRFILFHNKRHPREMGLPEIKAYPSGRGPKSRRLYPEYGFDSI